MADALRQAVKRLNELADRATDPELRGAVDAAVAAAVAERMFSGEVAKQIAERVSARQAREMAALYGPTGFSRAHIEPDLIAEEIRASDLL